MTLNELKELIDDLLTDGMSPETEVRFMSQPNWPFEYSISGVCKRSDFQPAVSADGELVGDVDGEYDGLDEDERQKAMAADLARIQQDENRKECVFLIEGSQLCYGHREAWDAARR